MVTIFIRHKVVDYDAWRRVYDDFADTQKAMGVTAEAVYRAQDDPNDLTVTHDFQTADEAQAFMASDELRGAMSEAGVVGQPTVWVTNRS
jgi:hypothetical protein